MSVVDWNNLLKRKPNVHLCIAINLEAFAELLTQSLDD